MIKFPKQVTAEFFEYATNLSLTELKTSVSNLINDKNGIGFSNGLAGKLVAENEFQIMSNWEIGPLVTGPLSYLNSNTHTNIRVFIYADKDHIAKVNLLVNPNSYYPLLFVLLPICLLALLLMSNNDGKGYFIIISLLFLCPIIILSISAFLKNRLKGKLVKYLNLQELN